MNWGSDTRAVQGVGITSVETFKDSPKGTRKLAENMTGSYLNLPFT